MNQCNGINIGRSYTLRRLRKRGLRYVCMSSDLLMFSDSSHSKYLMDMTDRKHLTVKEIYENKKEVKI